MGSLQKSTPTGSLIGEKQDCHNGSFSSISRKLIVNGIIAPILAVSLVLPSLAAEKVKNPENAGAPQYSSIVSRQNQNTSKMNALQQQLCDKLTVAKCMAVVLSENEIQICLGDKSKNFEFKILFEDFRSIAKHLEGMPGLVIVALSGVPEGTSRRIENELKEGPVFLQIERSKLGKILEYAKRKLPYKEALKFFEEGNAKDIISFAYPTECEDYIRYHARELTGSPLLSNILRVVHTLNANINRSEIEKFQMLATKIIREEYGTKKITAEDAAIAISKWISNNILYTGLEGKIGQVRTFSSAIDVLRSGGGVCIDHSNLMYIMCNSIGIPARTVCIVRSKFEGILNTGFHTAVEVNLGGKWYIFEPTNHYVFSEDHYTREKYFGVLATLGYKNPYVIINPSKPIKKPIKE